ncbi:MAG: T9SS C-terminal target domain-containing protein [Candidatus Kapaibacterium sp.]|nr:MAG: T9SS C-terminal target domain-containing protein [Candidatus Kapabacteria bacterium]
MLNIVVNIILARCLARFSPHRINTLGLKIHFFGFLGVFASFVLLLFAPSVFTQPMFAQPIAQSERVSLRDTRNSADYIVIARRDFAAELDSYVRWRGTTTSTHKALRTFVAYTDDILREFSDSTSPQRQAEAIRSFISHALQSWQAPKPQYVVLMGSTSVVPAYRIRVTDPEFATPFFLAREDSLPMDNWYIVNKHIESFNTRPQAAIGRIPGRAPNELRRVLQKIRTFEEFGNWMNYSRTTRFTSILDDASPGDGSDFTNWSDALFQFLRAKTRQNISVNNFSYLAVKNDANPKQRTLAAINSGSPSVLYFGHGAPDEWSGFRMITTDDVWNSFARDGRPFMFASLGCSQNFDIRTRLSIVESMMLLDNGGAVMTLASSGYSNGPFGRFYLTNFFSELLQRPGMDIGTAIFRSNDVVFETALIEQDNLYRRFALLGDPAMVPIARFFTSVQERGTSSQETTKLEMQCAPNPASAQAGTSIRYTLPHASRVRCELLSVLGQPLWSAEFQQQSGEHSVHIPCAELSSGVYICRVVSATASASASLQIVK